MTNPYSWLAALDNGDLADFVAEMRAALNTSATARDAGAVERCLDGWRTTAEALSDPRRREALTGPGTGDYVEVARP